MRYLQRRLYQCTIRIATRIYIITSVIGTSKLEASQEALAKIQRLNLSKAKLKVLRTTLIK